MSVRPRAVRTVGPDFCAKNRELGNGRVYQSSIFVPRSAQGRGPCKPRVPASPTGPAGPTGPATSVAASFRPGHPLVDLDVTGQTEYPLGDLVAEHL